MPNHIQNRLKVIGSTDQTNEILTFISSTDEEGTPIQIDFNKIKPMPDGLKANPHSGIEMWVKICTGQLDFKAMLKHASGGKSFGRVLTFTKMSEKGSSVKAANFILEAENVGGINWTGKRKHVDESGELKKRWVYKIH